MNSIRLGKHRWIHSFREISSKIIVWMHCYVYEIFRWWLWRWLMRSAKCIDAYYTCLSVMASPFAYSPNESKLSRLFVSYLYFLLQLHFDSPWSLSLNIFCSHSTFQQLQCAYAKRKWINIVISCFSPVFTCTLFALIWMTNVSGHRRNDISIDSVCLWKKRNEWCWYMRNYVLSLFHWKDNRFYRWIGRMKLKYLYWAILNIFVMARDSIKIMVLIPLFLDG